MRVCVCVCVLLKPLTIILVSNPQLVDSLKNGATLTSAGRNVSLHDIFFLHKFAFIFFIESCWWKFMCKTILRDELINQP